ncbi:radical SAM protein [Candidatus Margulisiibacteriota bacterium]
MNSLFRQYKLTDTCDLECGPCKLWQRNTEEEFPFLSEVYKDLEVLKKRGVRYLNFTGGDPLLHPNVVEILKKAKSLGFKTAVTTHGGNYLGFQTGLKDLADLMIFLLHSHEPGVHDQIAGVDSYSKVISAIEFAQENKQKVMISFNVTRDNIQFIPEMHELVTAKKALLWLNPLPISYGINGFKAESLQYIKHYGRRPNIWLNLASLWYLENKQAGLKERQDCIARDEIITLAESKINIPYMLNMFSWIVLRWKLAKQR